MRIYDKAKLSSDSKGYFRWLGGKQVRFGHDRARATLAHAKVLALWERIVAAGDTWTEVTWWICTALRKGERSVTIPPNPNMSGAESYAHWIERHRVLAGDLLDILPEQPDYYQQGTAEMSAARERQLAFVEQAYPAPVTQLPASETLHQALDTYLVQLTEQHHNGTLYDRVRLNQVRFLREHFADLPLSRMTLAEMERMLQYLARRPPRKKDGQPIARTTATVELFALREFWRWLHRSDLFAWKRPDGWEELRVKVASLPSDSGKLLSAIHIATYTIEELTTLYRYATPIARLFILTGLNCGFSIAEFSSLTASEVSLAENMIKRIRHKTGVYGEWTLWQHTAQGLRWAMRRKAKIGGQTDALIVSEQGRCFNAKTATGNKGTRIPKLWTKLHAKIRRDHPDFRHLPPKQLRKIGADFIHKVSNGEIAGLYLAHGSPVQTDPLANRYSNRAFAELHKALDQVEKQLAPMFAAVPKPFPGD